MEALEQMPAKYRKKVVKKLIVMTMKMRTMMKEVRTMRRREKMRKKRRISKPQSPLTILKLAMISERRKLYSSETCPTTRKSMS